MIASNIPLQSITTTYIAPTATRGSRIKVSCEAKTIYVAYGYEGTIEQEHTNAAKQLIEQLGWNDDQTTWYIGGHAKGYHFVRVR